MAVNEENIIDRVANEVRSESQAPASTVFTVPVPAAAEEGDVTINVGVVPFAGAVTSASYTSLADYAESATLYQTHSLVDLGAEGAGTTVTASLTTKKEAAAKEKLVKGVAKPLALSAVAKATLVAAGDVLQFKKIHTGKSAADTGGVLTVTVSRVVKAGPTNTATQNTGYVGTGS